MDDDKKEEAPKQEQEHPTLATFWPRFWAEHVTGLEPGTQDDMARSWRLHLGPELGDVRVRDIDASRIHAFRDLLKGKSTLKKASTRNKILYHLRSALSFAVERKVIAPGDLPKFRDEKVSKVKKPVYREEDIDAMLAAGSDIDTEHEVYILLLVDGALRIGELNAIHWEDIDLRQGTMLVQRTEYNNAAKEAPKGHVGTVPLTPELKDALLRWKQGAGSRGPIVLPMKDEETGRWQCRHGAGLLKSIQMRAGVRASGPHLLRHSVLTIAAREKATTLALQKLARHTDPTTTAKYYIHLEDAELAQQALDVLTRRRRRHPAGPVTPVPTDGTPTADEPRSSV